MALQNISLNEIFLFFFDFYRNFSIFWDFYGILSMKFAQFSFFLAHFLL